MYKKAQHSLMWIVNCPAPHSPLPICFDKNHFSAKTTKVDLPNFEFDKLFIDLTKVNLCGYQIVNKTCRRIKNFVNLKLFCLFNIVCTTYSLNFKTQYIQNFFHPKRKWMLTLKLRLWIFPQLPIDSLI